MKIGAVFPNPEIGIDPSAVRDFAVGAEELGVKFIATYDHVVGADISQRPDWAGPYTEDDPFHEPFVLFSYMAAVTSTLEFSTCIMILPQRQTALVAKQAAELAILSDNRFRLGAGVGWNQVEYEALGVPWEDRGSRLEEQVDLLRLLWSEHSIDFQGAFEHIPRAGINPRPTKPVPIWLGGGVGSARTLRRTARLADGWMAPSFNVNDMLPSLAQWKEFIVEAGRDPDSVGLDAIVPVRLHGEDTDSLRQAIDGWKNAGATHLSIATHRTGCVTVDDHLSLLAKVIELGE